MGLRGFLKELHRRRVYGVAVAYVATAAVLLEVLTHLFHNFDAPHWVLKVITTLLILGLPLACLMAWGFEFKGGDVDASLRRVVDQIPTLVIWGGRGGQSTDRRVPGLMSHVPDRRST